MTTGTAEIQEDSPQGNPVCEAKAKAQPNSAGNFSEQLKNKLSAYMAEKGICSQVALARHLGVGKGKVRAWLNGSRFPTSKYARKLIEAGVLTQDELASMRPPRKPRERKPSYWVRHARVYSLAEYAARG